MLSTERTRRKEEKKFLTLQAPHVQRNRIHNAMTQCFRNKKDTEHSSIPVPQYFIPKVT